MLEELINLNLSMIRRKPKSFVKKKFKIYSQAYENSEKDIQDKITYRETRDKYLKYMQRSGK